MPPIQGIIGHGILWSKGRTSSIMAMYRGARVVIKRLFCLFHLLFFLFCDILTAYSHLLLYRSHYIVNTDSSRPNNIFIYLVTYSNSAVSRFFDHNQGRSDGGGYRYLYPPKSAQVNFLWGKMTSERLFNSFIHPQKLLYPQNKFLATPLPRICT